MNFSLGLAVFLLQFLSLTLPLPMALIALRCLFRRVESCPTTGTQMQQVPFGKLGKDQAELGTVTSLVPFLLGKEACPGCLAIDVLVILQTCTAVSSCGYRVV